MPYPYPPFKYMALMPASVIMRNTTWSTVKSTFHFLRPNDVFSIGHLLFLDLIAYAPYYLQIFGLSWVDLDLFTDMAD